jgi:hypothetical protein
MMKVHGACHCGAITINGEVDPEKVTLCHCSDCQTMSGAPFRSSVPVPGNTFNITGKPATYVKTAESGNRRAQTFCPACGTPLYSTEPGDGPKDSYMVRVGILKERDALAPRRQIWMRSAQHWLGTLDDLPKQQTQAGTSHLR